MYPESDYDGADGSLDQDLSEANYRREEINEEIAEYEDTGQDVPFELLQESRSIESFLNRYGV